MDPAAAAAVIVAVLGTGGLLGGIVALMRVRPESGRMIVEAAEGAVVVQSGVITELRRGISELREELELAHGEGAECARRCNELELEVAELVATLRRHGINGAPSSRPPAPPPSAA